MARKCNSIKELLDECYEVLDTDIDTGETTPRVGYLRSYFGRSYNTRGKQHSDRIAFGGKIPREDVQKQVKQLVEGIPGPGKLWVEGMRKGSEAPFAFYLHEQANDEAADDDNVRTSDQAVVMMAKVLAGSLRDQSAANVALLEQQAAIPQMAFELGAAKTRLEDMEQLAGQQRLAVAIEGALPAVMGAVGHIADAVGRMTPPPKPTEEGEQPCPAEHGPERLVWLVNHMEQTGRQLGETVQKASTAVTTPLVNQLKGFLATANESIAVLEMLAAANEKAASEKAAA